MEDQVQGMKLLSDEDLGALMREAYREVLSRGYTVSIASYMYAGEFPLKIYKTDIRNI